MRSSLAIAIAISRIFIPPIGETGFCSAAVLPERNRRDQGPPGPYSGDPG